jgi:addiction module RelB/DinJ family antitoxin
MAKDTSISIRLDSKLKEQIEIILSQLGLNMTSVVNMLFLQIVREQAIPLSLSLKHVSEAPEELCFAKADRESGYIGRAANIVAEDMERIIMGVENGTEGLSCNDRAES